MNYLAHAYFSFEHEEMLIGNLISDFVKGRRKFDYSENIQKGISLHRAIDNFTDAHDATRAARQFFKPAVGLYSGAFVDVVYDHFLANHAEYWEQDSLRGFSSSVYAILTGKFEVLPQQLQQMLPFMKSQDWLYNYQFEWGIQRSFEGVARRALYLNNSIAAFEAFIEHYPALQQLSQSFLADVKNFASGEFRLLMQD